MQMRLMLWVQLMLLKRTKSYIHISFIKKIHTYVLFEDLRCLPELVAEVVADARRGRRVEW